MKKVMYRCDFLIDQKERSFLVHGTYTTPKSFFKPTPYQFLLIMECRVRDRPFINKKWSVSVKEWKFD